MNSSRALDRLAAWSPVLLLGGLAVLTWWLDAQIQPPLPPNDGASRHDVDIYVENVRATSFGANGKPTQLLKATRGEHFPDDNTTTFSDIDLVVRDPKQPEVQVTAASAKLSGDRNDVWLSGNVHARREPEAPHPGTQNPGAATLVTEFLHVQPHEKLADTDRAVRVADNRGVINAVGMKLDADAGVVRFLAQVHGTVEPAALSQSNAPAQPPQVSPPPPQAPSPPQSQ
jgi:lipopolysaccharide export system protein LptC